MESESAVAVSGGVNGAVDGIDGSVGNSQPQSIQSSMESESSVAVGGGVGGGSSRWSLVQCSPVADLI